MADFDSVYRSKTLHSLPAWNLADIDAVLVLSFGGPEGPEQVLPFWKMSHGDAAYRVKG